MLDSRGKNIPIHPGESLQFILEVRQLDCEVFAEQSCIEITELHKLLNGEISISQEIAVKLAKILNTSLEMRENLQNSYEEDLRNFYEV